MSTLYQQQPRDMSRPVNREYPLSVEIMGTASLPPVRGRTIVTPPIQIPGIGTGSAYADGDAFGTLIRFRDVFPNGSGYVAGAYLIDLDKESIQVDIPLFISSFTATTDNSAFAPSANDLLRLRGFVSIDSFLTWSANAFGQSSKQGLWIKADGPDLWTQTVIRGAANIAAGSLPWVGLVVVPD